MKSFKSTLVIFAVSVMSMLGASQAKADDYGWFDFTLTVYCNSPENVKFSGERPYISSLENNPYSLEAFTPVTEGEYAGYYVSVTTIRVKNARPSSDTHHTKLWVKPLNDYQLTSVSGFGDYDVKVPELPSKNEERVFYSQILNKNRQMTIIIGVSDGKEAPVAPEVQTETVSFGDYDSRTYVSENNLKFDEDSDVEAYIITGYDNGEYTMERVLGIVPAGTALLLVNKGESADAQVEITAEEPTADVANNLLQPAYAGETVPGADPDNSTATLIYDPSLGEFIEAADSFEAAENQAYLVISKAYEGPEEVPGSTTAIGSIDADSQSLTFDGNTISLSANAATIISDMNGRIVLRSNARTIDLSTLSAGCYIARSADQTLKFYKN